MNLPKDVWYVKLFRACLYLWASFRCGESWERDGFIATHEHRTNLCFFVRTITVWAPLVIVLHVLAYGAAIAALAIVPIYFFGAGGYGHALIVLAVIGVALVG